MIALAVAAFLATQAVGTPEVVRVDLVRGSSSCSGSVHYVLPLASAPLRNVLGNATRVMPIVVPCARIDAVDTLLPLPDSLSGALSVRTISVTLYRDPDGTCRADLIRELTPTNADVAAVRGSVVLGQQLKQVACTRINQALAGAQIAKGNAGLWPSNVTPLPMSVEP